MNIEGYHAAGNSYSYETRKTFSADSKSSTPDDIPIPVSTPEASPKVSPPSYFQGETYSNFQEDYRMNSAFIQVNEQRKDELQRIDEADDEADSEAENFLQKYVSEGEEEGDEKSESLTDYLLEALKGNEQELNVPGNSYMSVEDKLKYYETSFPELFPPGTFNL